jgi:two-component system, OmpR family, phosphate regulon response regulator PhoB
MDTAKQPSASFRQSPDDEPPAGDSKVPEMIAAGEKIRVLVVEDDPDISAMLEYTLTNSECRVLAVGDCQSALRELAGTVPNLVLLDWMLPDMSGIELLRRMRREPRLREIPVIMLTARGEEADRVRGLESGADDYVVKPFSIRELKARINTHLRKQVNDRATTFSIDGLVLDQESYRTTVNGQQIELGPTEFRLLRHFMGHRDRVFTRSQLLDAVWGTNVYIEERTVDVHIRRLRKALEPSGKEHLIQTVRGAGYRFSTRV